MDIFSDTYNFSKRLAVLVDPDEYKEKNLAQLANYAKEGWIQLFLVGGSLLVKNHMSLVVDYLKEHCDVPVIIFPGDATQIYEGADGLLLLSLISGRNPELLIGRHVEASMGIKRSGLTITPTGYILVDGGKITSVSYISNTTPIPSDKPDIAVATALAGEQLGLKAIYLEAGSGALRPIPTEMISKIRATISLPILVGGGIKTKAQVMSAFQAGADVVVIGNAIEKDPTLIQSVAIERATSIKI